MTQAQTQQAGGTRRCRASRANAYKVPPESARSDVITMHIAFNNLGKLWRLQQST